MINLQTTFTVTEFCVHTGVSEIELKEIVGLGIIQPCDAAVSDWLFDEMALSLFIRAKRLQDELMLDWPGIAVTMDLLAKLEQLRRENSHLHRRLSRFMGQ